MADHTAPDYYEQVCKEAGEKSARDNAQIDQEVDKLVEAHMAGLKRELAAEFGHASVRMANLLDIENVLYSIARMAARKAQDVMIESHYQQSRGLSEAMVQAVFVGIELAQEH